MNGENLYLVEEFYSAQFEGRRFGELSIFIRFFGCNRTCSDLGVSYKVKGSNKIRFGCDTYYAVDKDFETDYKKTTFNNLVDIVNKYKCKNVVITGGEPLINIQKPDFINFIDYLNENKYRITIETNGDIDIEKVYINKFRNTIFSISPKEKILSKSYWFLNKDSYIKVIFNHSKLDTEYLKSLKEKGIDIYIMPKGDNHLELEKQRVPILDYCIQNGFNYTTREQVYIFGPDGKEKEILLSKR